MAKRGRKKATRRRTQTARRRTVTKETPQVMPKKGSSAGLVLAIIALALLVVNVVFVLSSTQWILEQVALVGLSGAVTAEALFTYGILWIVLAIVTIMLVLVFQARRTRAWWLMLILGIITVIAGRALAGILLIIASFCYKKFLCC
ncbi:MAG: hypothetical protein JSW08_00540 [archaeon]|nr:MAG: hypothetical protein JSW08_00540 [archaeon]